MTSVLAVVGTDRHRFDRLIGWLERWHAGHHPDPPRLVIQHGYSRQPTVPGAVAFFGHAQLQAAMAEAALVVSHGGPATITEARRAGHLPIVVPRDPARGEHVDDHQQLFARRLSRDRMVRLCESESELADALDAGLADTSAYRWRADPAESHRRAAAVTRVGHIVEELMAGHGRRRWRRGRPGASAGGRRQ